MKNSALIAISFFLAGCTSWKYNVSEDGVIFRITSWNHDPIEVKVEGADPETFRVKKRGYAIDENSVFYKGVRIDDAEPRSFRMLSDGYAADDVSVYLYRCRLDSADPERFEVLEERWGRDSYRVYHGYRLVAEADASTFQLVGRNWAIDHQRAFHALPWATIECSDNDILEVKVFEGIDPSTFSVLSGFTARDKNRTYDALTNPDKVEDTNPDSGSAPSGRISY